MIYMPFENLASKTLIHFENVYIMNKINNILNESLKNDTSNQYIFQMISKSVITIFSNLDTMILFNSLLYFIIEPFLIVKMIVLLNFPFFFVIMLRFLIKNYRPFWNINGNLNSLCDYSFSSPSLKITITTIYWTYLAITLLTSKKNKGSYSSLGKFAVTLSIILVISIVSLDSLVNLQNFLHQLIFGIVISMGFMVLFIDFDTDLHNFLMKTMKNLYKIREFKIKFLIYILSFMIFTVVIYNIVDDDPKMNEYQKLINSTMV